MENLFKNKTIITATVIFVVVLIGAYLYFWGPKSGSNVDALLTSETPTSDSSGAGDQELFVLLQNTQKAADELDAAIFSKEIFKSLKNFNQDIPVFSNGRTDPFLPIGVDPVIFVSSNPDMTGGSANLEPSQDATTSLEMPIVSTTTKSRVK